MNATLDELRRAAQLADDAYLEQLQRASKKRTKSGQFARIHDDPHVERALLIKLGAERCCTAYETVLKKAKEVEV